MSDRQGKITEITIRNFKSIREVRIGLQEGVNVLIGSNGSGKTNVLEAIYFLRKALIDEYGKEPYLPHLEWWDPLNLLPEHKEDNTLQYTIRGTLDNEIRFEYTVSFALPPDRSTLIPIEHNLKIEDYTTVKLIPGAIYVYLDRSLVETALKLVEKEKEEMLPVYEEVYRRLKDIVNECRDEVCVTATSFPWMKPYINLRDIPRIGLPFAYTLREGKMRLGIGSMLLFPRKPTEGGKTTEQASLQILFIIKMPLGKATNKVEEEVGSIFIFNQIIDLIERIIFIKHPDIGSIRKAKRVSSYDKLDVRAENLVSVMYRFSRMDRGFMERVSRVISEFFPNAQLSFDILPDGRISLLMYEDGVSYPSPCMSDGLIKLLTILVAMELGPSVLLIDEIENSMHARMLERIYDELNNSDFPVLVATHSPYFIDLTDLERIYLVKKDREKGTVIEKTSEPRKLREELEKEGLTFSEYLLTTE